MRWVDVLEEPCQWCAFWRGPHQHSVMPDGTLGIVMRKLDPDTLEPLGIQL